MKGYFFIPATKINKIESIKEMGSYEIIVDFEDAVMSHQRSNLVEQFFTNYERQSQLWIRLPLQINELDNQNLFNEFISRGYHFFVVPKIKSVEEYNLFINKISHKKNVKFILLVEHPLLLIKLGELLASNPNNLIKSVGLGSHDLFNILKAKHSIDNLSFPRNVLLYNARAYGLDVIDIAAMNVTNENLFKEEVRRALYMGFDGKFLIHPNQGTWLSQVINSNTQLEWARIVVASLPFGINTKEIEPFILNGEVIEKPHIFKAIQILKTATSNEK